MSFANDTFTGTDGTQLASHTSDSGHSWVNYDGSGAADHTIQSNRLSVAGSNYASFTVNVTPPSADYDVQADFIRTSAVGAAGAWIAGRFNSTTGVFYQVLYWGGTPGWELKDSDGNQLDTFNQVLTQDQTYVVKLQMRGAILSVYIDDVLRMGPYDDSLGKNITDANRPGYGSDASFMVIDNYSATAASANAIGVIASNLYMMRRNQ